MKRFKNNGAILQAITAVASILIGAAMLFSKNVQFSSLCYVFCIVLWGIGIYEIVSYFLSKSYQHISDYGFTLGVLLILLGLVGLIRINDMTRNVKEYMQLFSLIQSIFILQNSVQMYALKSKAWLLDLIFSLLMILLSIFAFTGQLKQYTYSILMFAGIFGCISVFLSSMVVRSFHKKTIQEMPKEKVEDEEKH